MTAPDIEDGAVLVRRARVGIMTEAELASARAHVPERPRAQDPTLVELRVELREAELARASVEAVVAEAERGLEVAGAELDAAQKAVELATESRERAEAVYQDDPSRPGAGEAVHEADAALRLASLKATKATERHGFAERSARTSREGLEAKQRDVRRLELLVASSPESLARALDPVMDEGLGAIVRALDAMSRAQGIIDEASAKADVYRREGFGAAPEPNAAGAGVRWAEHLANLGVFLTEGEASQLRWITGGHGGGHLTRALGERPGEVLALIVGLLDPRRPGGRVTNEAFIAQYRRDLAIARGGAEGAKARAETDRLRHESTARANAAPYVAPAALTRHTGPVRVEARDGLRGRLVQEIDLVPAPSPPTLPELAARVVNGVANGVADRAKRILGLDVAKPSAVASVLVAGDVRKDPRR